MKFKGMEKVGDLIILNLLFILCSLPLFTLGSSAVAMHYTLRRWREGEGKLASGFFRAFRQNFRQATILWLAFLALATGIGLNFWLISSWKGAMYTVVSILLIVLAYLMLAWVSVVFPLLARFDNTTGQMAKNAILLSMVNPVRSIIAVTVNIFPVVFAILLPDLFLVASVLWLLLLCSVSALLIQIQFSPVFDRIGENDDR